MSRCRACDAIMASSEMYVREIETEDGTVEVMEDLCSKCRKIILNDYEEGLENMALDFLEEECYYDDYDYWN